MTQALRDKLKVAGTWVPAKGCYPKNWNHLADLLIAKTMV
jgi:hypothetical protein